ncbi:MAG: hypothetical protein KDC27_14445 [Acidobacteria bacterium]|nr:hypothetical protein [Acidobacteriota bacterium]
MIAGPDSRAQIAIQAAERLRTLGAGVPWQVTPPLPPALIAALATIGLSPADAYVLLVVVAFLACAAAVFALCRRIGAAPWLALAAAGLTLVAPSGILAIWERGEIDRLLFWKLVPLVFLAIDRFRRKPSAPSIALIFLALGVLVLTRNTRFIAFDLLALVEWILIFALVRPWRERMPRRALLLGACAALFAVIAFGRLQAVTIPGSPAPMPAALATLPHAAGPVSLDALFQPGAEQALALIRSGLRPDESLLWLQALGAESVLAPYYSKYARELECVERQGDWCAFSVGPAPRAVLVSRERFATLRPIRGLFDVEGLERYLTWAQRPEAVGFEQDGPRIRVHGEAGPDDVVLIRVNAAEWTSNAATQVDPLGFVVLDPGAPGPFETTLAFHKTKPAPSPLDDADYPRILPEGVVEATAYAAPPFAPAAYLAIFGERFRPGVTQALLDGQDLPVSYSSVAQINVQLPADIAPGPHELLLNAAGAHSYPYHFEVTQ